MKHSESIAHLAPALARVQSALRAIGKDSKNPDVHSRYLSNTKLVETVRPVLAAEELSILQGAEYDQARPNTLVITTTLLHASGEWVSEPVPMPLVGRMLKGGGRAEPDPQAAGSALSYGRRYGLSALLCIVADEDDDGNAARSDDRPAERPSAPAKPRPSATMPTAGKVADAIRLDPKVMPMGPNKGQPMKGLPTSEIKAQYDRAMAELTKGDERWRSAAAIMAGELETRKAA